MTVRGSGTVWKVSSSRGCQGGAREGARQEASCAQGTVVAVTALLGVCLWTLCKGRNHLFSLCARHVAGPPKDTLSEGAELGQCEVKHTTSPQQLKNGKRWGTQLSPNALTYGSGSSPFFTCTHPQTNTPPSEQTNSIIRSKWWSDRAQLMILMQKYATQFSFLLSFQSVPLLTSCKFCNTLGKLQIAGAQWKLSALN